MKEFLSKSWMVTKMWAYLLGYSLIGLPYVMWKIGQAVFEQGGTNFDTVMQEVKEGLSSIL